MSSQNQERLERWDGVVAAWLAEVSVIDPDAISVRPEVKPQALIISTKRTRRQQIQLKLNARGFLTITAPHLDAGLDLLTRKAWDLLMIDGELLAQLTLHERAGLAACRRMLVL